MKMKKLFLLSTAALLTLAGCGEKPENSNESSTTETPSSEIHKETYSISANLPNNIQISIPSEAKEGETVTLALTYDENAILVTKVMVNNTVECTSLGNKKYSFVMPNENVTISVQSEAKTNKYVISNGNAEKVEITDSPSSEEEGKTVTFGYIVKSGYVFKDVHVTSNGEEIEITDNQDGTYSFNMPKGDVIIMVNTKNRLYKVTKDSETSSLISLIKCNYTLDYVNDEEATSPTDENIWSHDSKAEFSRLVTVTLTSKGSLKPSGIVIPELDNKEILLEEGEYSLSFTMPNKDITIQVKTVANTYPVHFTNSEHLTLSLYKKEGDSYTEINGVLPGETNYLKVLASETSFKVASLTYTYTPSTYGKDETVTLTDTDLLDGYYKITIPEMKDGTTLSFVVTEKEGGKFANYSFVGSYFGTVIEKGATEEVQWPTFKAITIDDSGYFTFDSKAYQVESADNSQKGIMTIKDESGNSFAMYFDGNSLLADSSFGSSKIPANNLYFAYRKGEDTPSYVRDMYRGYVDSVQLDTNNHLTSFQLMKKGEKSDFTDSISITSFVVDTKNDYYAIGNNVEIVLTEGTDAVAFEKPYQSYNILVDGQIKYALKQTGKYSPRRFLLDSYYGSYKTSGDAEATLLLDGNGNATYKGVTGYAYSVNENTLTLTGNGKKIILTINVSEKTYVFVSEEKVANPVLGTKWSDNNKITFTDSYGTENWCYISLEFTTSSTCHLSWEDEYYDEDSFEMSTYTIVDEGDYGYVANGNSISIKASRSNNPVEIQFTLSEDGNKLTFANNPVGEEVKGQSLVKAK